MCPPQQGKGNEGLENLNRRWAAASFQPGAGPPPSQKAEQWLPEPLSELSQAAKTKLDSTASHKSSAKGNIACFPYLNPTSSSLLPHNPTSNKWGKEERKNGFPIIWSIFFSLLARQVPPFTNLLGPWTLFFQLPSQIHLLFLSQPLSQLAFALSSMKVHDWNYRLSMNDTWGGTG